MKKILALIIVILIIGIFSYLTLQEDVVEVPEVRGELTDFSRVGVVTFNNPGQPDDKFILVHEAPGSPALTKELLFDEVSFCSEGYTSTHCLDVIESLEENFMGVRVSVEGVLQEDEKILVRKIQLIEGSDETFTSSVGRVFITWKEALSLIEACAVDQVSQSHDLDIKINLKSRQTVYTVTPIIDEVFDVVAGAVSDCGEIIMSTE